MEGKQERLPEVVAPAIKILRKHKGKGG